MKKIFGNIRTLAALLIASATLAACSTEDSVMTDEKAPQVYTLTIDASMDGGAQTRALELDGTKLVAKWANGETVDVRRGATLLGTLTVSNVSADGQTCTLSGTLTGSIDKNDALRFYYNFSGTLVNESQTGTLSSTAASDYAMAAVTVKSVNGGNITLESAPSFKTQVAVLKITMQDALANKLNATSLKIKIGDKDLCTLSPSATAYTENGAGVAYFALPSAHRVYTEGISSIGLDEDQLAAATVTFTATAGGNTYIATKTGYPFAAGKYYATTLTMAEEPEVAGSYFTANSSGLKVAFSQGNLQATYNGSDWTWAFAAHQYDYIGDASGNTQVTDYDPFISENATVDLFGWVGASSNFTGVAQYGITSSKTLDSEDGYGNVADESMKAEWNSTNLTITNGGTYTWRTLTGGEGGEWDWIIGQLYYADPGTNCRASGATVNGVANARYTHATINTDGTPVHGMILFPDGCKINSSSATSWGNINSDSEWGTKCTIAQWSHLEDLGCVFLPAAGWRKGSSVDEVGSDGYYWSSSHRVSDPPFPSDTEFAHNMYFGSWSMNPTGYDNRYRGYSVRLVHDVPAGSQGTQANDRSYGDQSDLGTW